MAALDEFFDALLQRGGTDLHLSVGHPPTIRVRGRLQTIRNHPLDARQVEGLMYEILDERREEQFEYDADLDFVYDFDGRARLRASYLLNQTGPGAVFRLIPSEIPTAEALGLPPSVLALADKPEGLVLVTGPPGSGRSTTLSAMVSHINRRRSGHILTIEEPLEFVHAPIGCKITHREVGRDTPSFAGALRSAMRENAEVVLVGELADQETMRLALQLAEAGVLVLAAYHAQSAAASIARFIRAFAADQQPVVRTMLADSLTGVIAQQLLLTPDTKGKRAAHEILVANTAVRQAIRDSKISVIPSIIHGGGREGMQSMDLALKTLVEAGKVSATDALEAATDKDGFAKLPGVAANLNR